MNVSRKNSSSILVDTKFASPLAVGNADTTIVYSVTLQSLVLVESVPLLCGQSIKTPPGLWGVRKGWVQPQLLPFSFLRRRRLGGGEAEESGSPASAQRLEPGALLSGPWFIVNSCWKPLSVKGVF